MAPGLTRIGLNACGDLTLTQAGQAGAKALTADALHAAATTTGAGGHRIGEEDSIHCAEDSRV